MFKDSQKYTVFKPLGNGMSVSTNLLRTEMVTFPARPTHTTFLKPSMYICAEHSTDRLTKYITDISDVDTLELYVYLAGDLKKDISTTINMDEMVKLYYPRLYRRIGSTNNITIKNIQNIHIEISSESTQLYEENVPYFNHIAAFNATPITASAYLYGITKLVMTYNNSLNISFPMDYIFKTLHTSELIPCIKFCKTRKSEQFIRLYQPNEIPVASKGSVIKMMNLTGKSPGITGMFPIDKYVYVNAIPVTIPSNSVIYLHLTYEGNITVYYETNCKNIISYVVLIDLVKSMMGFFSSVINNAILSYKHKLPTEYSLFTNREMVVTECHFAVAYERVNIQSLIKVLTNLPAVFSQSVSGSLMPIAKNIGLYTMLYNRSSNYVAESIDSTTITITNDKLSNNITIMITNIPYIIDIPIISDYISKFMSLTEDKVILNNYLTSCVSNYNIYTDQPALVTNQETYQDFSSTNAIPISTLYSSIDTSSPDPETHTMDDVLKHLEMLLVLNSENNTDPRPANVDMLNDTTTDITAEDDVELGDIGW
jgi:hypothetical protein